MHPVAEERAAPTGETRQALAGIERRTRRQREKSSHPLGASMPSWQNATERARTTAGTPHPAALGKGLRPVMSEASKPYAGKPRRWAWSALMSASARPGLGR
jgi:hypothetical protein